MRITAILLLLSGLQLGTSLPVLTAISANANQGANANFAGVQAATAGRTAGAISASPNAGANANFVL
jgi:hypothetical protein